MNIFTLVTGLAICAAIGVAQAAAPAHGNDMSARQLEMRPAGQMQYAGTGVLKEVQASKVRIAHDPIAELEWPAMTMRFSLRDALPQNIRVGDKVSFVMIQSDKKQWVIVRIEHQ